MSRVLAVAFTGSEVNQFDGFAIALNLPFDILLLAGTFTGTSEAEHLFTAGFTEIPPADRLDESITAFAATYSHVVAVSSMASKDLLPRLAAKLDGAAVTDVTAVNGPASFQRPFQAGSIVGTVEALKTPVVLTFRPSGFVGAASEKLPISEAVTLQIKEEGSRVVSVSAGSHARPDLTQAKLVVSGGRPLKDAETFEKVIGGFADAFGGAVGATRAAVDAGISPNETQVGQTGKIVAPDLYIAAGISGSTQHMAGIKDSKLIVAINKDPDAPIFESADLGIVGDLYEVLPALQDALKKR